LSLDDLKRRVTKRTRAVAVVHIGGHIAFQIEKRIPFRRAMKKAGRSARSTRSDAIRFPKIESAREA